MGVESIKDPIFLLQWSGRRWQRLVLFLSSPGAVSSVSGLIWVDSVQGQELEGTLAASSNLVLQFEGRMSRRLADFEGPVSLALFFSKSARGEFS
jgi:hypothetical protein